MITIDCPSCKHEDLEILDITKDPGRIGLVKARIRAKCRDCKEILIVNIEIKRPDNIVDRLDLPFNRSPNKVKQLTTEGIF